MRIRNQGTLCDNIGPAARKELASLLRVERARHRWSQHNLADQAGIAKSTLQRMEAEQQVTSSTRVKVMTVISRGAG